MGGTYTDGAWRNAMRVRVDYNNMMAGYVGEKGIEEAELAANAARYARAIQAVEEGRARMKWRELPFSQGGAVRRVEACAKRIRREYESFVVLGIGGSALGPIAVQQALGHLNYNELPTDRRGGPKLYVADNVDPERMAALLDVIDPEKTAFNVVTKSGSTSETMAQLLLFTALLKERLGGDWRAHVVATTDEKAGNLIKIAKAEDLETFYVPDGVGGRFSELCPVGLLAAAVCGVDIRELLAGAAYMDGLCSIQDYRRNPAFMSAALEVLAMEKGCNVSVLMPYADSLKYIADWYAQLWAESLGKRVNRTGEVVNSGQTPVKSLGVTDQHSQVQLYAEGPYDKVVTFVGVDAYRTELAIPRSFDDIPDVAFLSGHTFNELIKSEQLATEYALTKSGHMNKTITLPEVNAFTVGQLLYLFEMQTAFAGELLNIDAFDQPGVEEGKKATYALLGKAGYDDKRAELAARPEKNGKFIV
ncbi:MAG TPA: glucose-6-phosphate isomerase [Clostridia bacterium]|nr:glucose-6-phosphate isomerase [Clostridia bacterium]